MSFAIEKIFELSEKKIGETVYFEHMQEGLICCTVGSGFSSLSFNPYYVSSDRSTIGTRSARQQPPVVNEGLVFVDDVDVLSTIRPESVLPLIGAIRGLVFIFETHDFPPFLDWYP